MSNLSTRRQNRKHDHLHMQNQEDDELSAVTPTESQIKRSKTQGLQEYQQYFPKTRRKKFVQHSIFLPVIHHKKASSQNLQKIRNFRSQRNQYKQSRQKRMQQRLFNDNESDSEGSTIEYLNECERIIQNLKKLTEDSNNKAEKRVSRIKSRGEHKKKRSKTRNEDDDEQLDLYKTNMFSRNSDASRSNNIANTNKRQIKSSLNETQRKKESGRKSQNKINESTKQSKQQMERAAKEEEEQKIKADKKQRIFIKFMSKARNRGVELQNKIAEFRMRQSQRKKQQLEFQQADTLNSKAKMQKNKGNQVSKTSSPSKPSASKLPQQKGEKQKKQESKVSAKR